MELIHGAKAGQQQQAKPPSIAADSIASISKLKILYALSEGEIKGLAKGANSIMLEGTPLEDENGVANFEGVEWEIRYGTPDQTHIPGLIGVSNEIGINTAVRSSAPWIRTITDTSLSSINVNLSWSRLSETTAKFDVIATKVAYAIDLQTDGGGYVTVLNTSIDAKTSGRYQRTHNIPLPEATTNYQVRVRKITADGDQEKVFNAMQVDTVAEIIDAKLRYPNTALLYLSFDAQLFSNIPKLSVLALGRYVQVPVNYNPETHYTNGVWNGTFKQAFTNNPAWIYYDLITNDRYGLGDKLKPFMIDKWAIESIARLCDQPVDDGRGGVEPRYACNLYLQQSEEAYRVLQHIAGIFRGLSFWNGAQLMLDADSPRDADYVINRSNVIDGAFVKTGTAGADRHTVAKVAYSDPLNKFEVDYVMVRNEAAIAQYGINILDLAAVGCTSEGQAYRMGLAALLTEQNRTQTVTFSMGLEGALPTIGSRLDIADLMFTGKNNGGRLRGVSDSQMVLTLDRDNVAAVIGDSITVNTEIGRAQTRTITGIDGRRVFVSRAFNRLAAENVWVVSSVLSPTMPFIVLSITGNEDATQYQYTALQYDPGLYAQIDNGTLIENRPPIGPDSFYAIDAPASVAITTRERVVQGQRITTLVLTWAQVTGAVAYMVQWRKDGGEWINAQRTGNISMEIDGVYTGIYTARVLAVGAMGQTSKYTDAAPRDVSGRAGTVPAPANLKVAGVLFGFNLSWAFGDGANDAAYTEIEVGNKPSGGGDAPTTTVRDSLNLYDPSKVIADMAISATGAIGPSSYSISDFIPVQVGFRYVYTSSVQGRDAFISTAYYDASKNFITRVNTLNRNYPYYTAPLIPANVAYVRLNISGNPTAENRMFALGTAPKPYEPFGRITLNTANTGDANVSMLGQYSYPTDTAKITGLQGGLTQSFRARLVDKLGFKSEWSHWVKGTTEDSVAAMLDILNDKLTSSQLDIDLRTKVNKIEGIEDGVKQEIIDRKSEDSRVVGIINTTASTWGNNLAVVQDEVTAITSPTGAIATAINTLQSRVDKTTALRHYRLGSGKAEWRDYDGQAEIFPGNVLVIGDDAGDDQARLVHPDNIPLHDGVVYKITARVRNLTAGNRLLFGVAGVSVSGQSFVNVIGANTLSSQFYLADYTTADADYRILTGYIASAATDIPETANRKRLHASAKFFRPLLFANYPNMAGKVYADYIKIEVVDAELMASVQETKEAVNGAYAKWSMKLDVNGYVGGLTGGNNGQEVDFILRTDAFTLAPPSGNGNNINAPFTFRTTTANINGTIFPAGAYLKAAFIDALSVDTGHIKNLAVKSAQIDNLAVTKGKIADLSVDTLKIAGDAVTVARNQYTEAAVEFNMGSGEVTINEQTINAEGGNVTIQFAFERLEATPSGELTLRVKRNGTAIKTLTFEVQRYANGIERRDYQVGDDDRVSFVQVYSTQLKYAFGCIPAFNDIQPEGNVTYSVTLQQEGSGSAIIKSRSLLLMGSKK